MVPRQDSPTSCAFVPRDEESAQQRFFRNAMMKLKLVVRRLLKRLRETVAFILAEIAIGRGRPLV
jgi:hypothetical protein